MSHRRTRLVGALLIGILLSTLGIQTSSAKISSCASSKFSLWNHGQLRGFNIFAEHADPSWETNGPVHWPYTQADFTAMANLGANYVQISQPGLFRMRSPYAVDAEAQANLDQLLKMIRKSGLKAVIAFRTGPGRNEYAFRYQKDYDPLFSQHLYEPLWNSSKDQTAFVAMMQYTANRYKNNCVVIGYDPLVEPNYVSTIDDKTSNYPSPGDFYANFGDSIHDWNQLTPRITAAIRKVDKTTPILLEPESYGSVEYLPYLKVTGDSKTVYTIHNYEPQEIYTHQGSNGTTSYPGLMDTNGDGTTTLVDSHWQSIHLQRLLDFKLKYKVPIAITEMGVHRFVPGAATFLDDQFAVVDKFGASYALWGWRAPGDLYYDFDFRMGTDPNNEIPQPGNSLLEVLKKHFSKAPKLL